jgi:hypothetical protein
VPVTYPPPSPTVSGDILQIHQLLNSPTLLARRLRTVAENRFIADVLLPGRYTAVGGAIQYQQGESIYTDRPPESVRPGMEYPRSGLGFGPVQIAEVVKWGQDVPITDESIARLRMDPVNRGLTKVVNQMVKHVDGIALGAITSQVTATRAATALWTGSTAEILLDILLAVADVRGLNEGFEPDTVVVDDITFAHVASDEKITNALRREDASNPVYTGDFPVVAGLRILPSPNTPFATEALALDSTQLGGMADEQLGGPGYVGALAGVETKSMRKDDNDRWDLRGRRVTVPVVVEPQSAIRITGVRA